MKRVVFKIPGAFEYLFFGAPENFIEYHAAPPGLPAQILGELFREHMQNPEILRPD